MTIMNAPVLPGLCSQGASSLETFWPTLLMSPRIKIRKHTIFLVNNRLRDQSWPHVVTVSILAATTTTKSFRFILCFVHASSGFSHCPKASSTSHGRRVLYSLGCVCWMCLLPLERHYLSSVSQTRKARSVS